MKFELQYVQAQIDAVNNGEDLKEKTACSIIEAKLGQLARDEIAETGMSSCTCPSHSRL
jgi:hypothetical protein